MPTWVKWVAIQLVILGLIILPLVFFEAEADAWIAGLIAWSQDRPLLTALVVLFALTVDILLPVPNGLVHTATGSIFGWGFGALVIWLGLTLGCLVAYGLGQLAAKPLAQRWVGEEEFARARAFAARMGAVTLIVTRPVPMFGDLAVLAAGLTRFPFRRYLAITSVTNVGVAIVYAGIGSAAVSDQVSEGAGVSLALLGAVVLPLLAWLCYETYERRRAG